MSIGRTNNKKGTNPEVSHQEHHSDNNSSCSFIIAFYLYSLLISPVSILGTFSTITFKLMTSQIANITVTKNKGTKYPNDNIWLVGGCFCSLETGGVIPQNALNIIRPPKLSKM